MTLIILDFCCELSQTITSIANIAIADSHANLSSNSLAISKWLWWSSTADAHSSLVSVVVQFFFWFKFFTNQRKIFKLFEIMISVALIAIPDSISDLFLIFLKRDLETSSSQEGDLSPSFTLLFFDWGQWLIKPLPMRARRHNERMILLLS